MKLDKRSWRKVLNLHKKLRLKYQDWEYNGLIIDNNGYELINTGESETKIGGPIKPWQEDPDAIGTFHYHPKQTIAHDNFSPSFQDIITYRNIDYLYHVLGVEDGIVIMNRSGRVLKTFRF